MQQLRQALGFFGYYRRFVKDFSSVAQALHSLLQGLENTKRANKNTPVVLEGDALDAFHGLKQKMSQPPILGYADFTKPFEHPS